MSVVFSRAREDATIDLLKAVVEAVRGVQQQKLEAVLGENRAARGRRAEAWRSDLSVPALRSNVAALQALLREGSPALSSVFLPDDLPAIDSAFATLQQDLAAAPDSMNTAALADDVGYAALQRVHADLDVLFELLEAAVKKTDLYLGFNSLDGD
jgi:predicted lipoprotein